ncbi:hypothetical protein EVAR_5545_1 [Eumeta japonica]|uniref:Uncharacterized protein n=1 Tax=Eumeta variegata TaxID=151549 RepID=A0A4C1U189_EUMVA|nr:hypothetical protein EVAR_5545_1 [Eumeta japonica]
MRTAPSVDMKYEVTDSATTRAGSRARAGNLYFHTLNNFQNSFREKTRCALQSVNVKDERRLVTRRRRRRRPATALTLGSLRRMCSVSDSSERH